MLKFFGVIFLLIGMIVFVLGLFSVVNTVGSFHHTEDPTGGIVIGTLLLSGLFFGLAYLCLKP